MIIGPPPEHYEKRGYPCNKTDCKLYREWGFAYERQSEQKWYNNASDIHAPKWFCFGVFGCEQCKHFKGFDLYKKDTDSTYVFTERGKDGRCKL